MKNSYYFQHDYHSRNDPKILMLRSKYGAEGYGVFWMLVEIMAESADPQISFKTLPAVSVALNMPPQIVQEIIDYCIDECKLFVTDGEVFTSLRITAHRKIREEFQQAGIRGADIRWKDHRLKKDRGAIRGGNREPNAKERIVKDSIYIYDFYAKTIKPGCKEDAIRNIDKVLKAGITKEDLIGRINAYKQSLVKNPTEARYYIQANNFFGEKARYKDFEPVKVVKYSPADLNCKACHGSGNLQNGEGNVIKCYCRKEI